MVLPGLALAALTWWVNSRGVAGWELTTTREVWSWPDGVGVVLRPAVELGNRLVAVAVATVVAVRWGWRAGGAVAGGALGASLVAGVLKAVVERPRITPVQLGGDPRHVVDGFSFPSSHAAVAFGLAVGLTLVARAAPGPERRWVPVVLVGATLTALGRLWLGIHLPLDVVAGALVGTTCALLAATVVDRWSSRRAQPT